MVALSDLRMLTVTGMILMFIVPVCLFWKCSEYCTLPSHIYWHELYQHFKVRYLYIKIFICRYYV